MAVTIALAVAIFAVAFWREVLKLLSVVLLGLLLLGLFTLLGWGSPSQQSNPAQGTCFVERAGRQR
jgi:hypothetical protein